MPKKKLVANVVTQAPQPEGEKVPFPKGVSPRSGIGRIQRQQEEYQTAQKTDEIYKNVISGKWPVQLDPYQINEDPVGSDRLTYAPLDPGGAPVDDEEFEALLRSIEQDGQKEPIRVRPRIRSWRPDPAKPTKISSDTDFVIQSGRRRLAACRRIQETTGRPFPVYAALNLLPLDSEDPEELADLSERYRENRFRSQLSPYEDLLSLGRLTAYWRSIGHSFEKIIELSGRSKTHVSFAQRCYEQRDRIESEVGDPNSLSARELRDLISSKGKEVAKQLALPKNEKSASKLSVSVKFSDGDNLKIKERSGGLTLMADGVYLTEENKADLQRELREVLESFKNKTAN